MICDYCAEGNIALRGWHDYPPDEWGGAGYSVPCALNPPEEPR